LIYPSSFSPRHSTNRKNSFAANPSSAQKDVDIQIHFFVAFSAAFSKGKAAEIVVFPSCLLRLTIFDRVPTNLKRLANLSGIP
jgi:hypothetical protein